MSSAEAQAPGCWGEGWLASKGRRNPIGSGCPDLDVGNSAVWWTL